ncbi:MAG: hypothetical protein HXY50_07535 [Ignavibacteriaceae bacterium]|nr:hypothetical protein [Ignavibacteriaceae bacterium]
MKKFVSVAVLFVVFFIGCSNESSINSPLEDLVKEELMARENLSGLQLNKSLTITKEINGEEGGILFVGDFFSAQNGQPGAIFASCVFPRGAFKGTKTITMTVDDSTLTGTFSPHMEFDKPVLFSVLFTGLNLSKYDQSQISFVYFDENGTKNVIKSWFIHFNKLKGVLGILNAQLPHFSRYGFIRKLGVQNSTSSSD